MLGPLGNTSPREKEKWLRREEVTMKSGRALEKTKGKNRWWEGGCRKGCPKKLWDGESGVTKENKGKKKNKTKEKSIRMKRGKKGNIKLRGIVEEIWVVARSKVHHLGQCCPKGCVRKKKNHGPKNWKQRGSFQGGEQTIGTTGKLGCIVRHQPGGERKEKKFP